jgi:hypothetical protein
VRRTPFLILSAATLALVGACGGGGAPATLAPGTTVAPGTAVAPATQPAGPVGNTCSAYPTPNPAGSPQPVIPGDPELEALFPSEIDGAPVDDIASFNWLAYLCFYQGQSGLDDIVANVPGGIDPTFTYANADAVVAGEDVGIDAFRTPGRDAGLMVQNFAQLILILGGPIEETQGSMASASIGGKNAFVWTQPDAELSYLYPRGDVLFGMTDGTEAQAATIFAALP